MSLVATSSHDPASFFFNFCTALPSSLFSISLFSRIVKKGVNSTAHSSNTIIGIRNGIRAKFVVFEGVISVSTSCFKTNSRLPVIYRVTASDFFKKSDPFLSVS